MWMVAAKVAAICPKDTIVDESFIERGTVPINIIKYYIDVSGTYHSTLAYMAYPLYITYVK